MPGGLTVLARLAPALVAVRLVVTMLVPASAAPLHWRAGDAAGPPPSAAGWEVRLLARLLLLVLGAVIVLGTVATGAGPDAGRPDVPRFGFRFQAAAELPAVAVMFLAGLTVAMFFALRPGSVAWPVLRPTCCSSWRPCCRARWAMRSTSAACPPGSSKPISPVPGSW